MWVEEGMKESVLAGREKPIERDDYGDFVKVWVAVGNAKVWNK